MPAINYGLRIIKDYPVKNVEFIDINGLLANPVYFTQTIDKFCAAIQNTLSPESIRSAAVISPESRGFYFGAPAAYRLALPFLPIRKQGKIPHKPYRFPVSNEYDSYDMELDGDLLDRFEHFIYIDDILATGQTLASVKKALEAKGKKILLALHLTAVKELQSMRNDNPQLKGLTIQEIL